MKYWAFISYNHKDAAWARRVQASLEKIRIPDSAEPASRALGPKSTHLRPIFRDTDELAASSDLTEEIREALDEAAYLVVICTPRSAASRWVEAELRHFIDRGRADRILLLLVDGEPRARTAGAPDPTAAFSAALDAQLAEPLWVDARPGAETVRRAMTRLAAGMLGVGFDELWQRHRRSRRRRLAAQAGAGAAGLIAFSVLLFVQSQAVDLSRCPLGALAFRDPVADAEFRVAQVGVDHRYLCGIDREWVQGDTAGHAGKECQGPYGETVLKGVFRDDPMAQAPDKSIYFVWSVIKGAPCCWWNALDEDDAKEIVGRPTFRWLVQPEQPHMGSVRFASIELDDQMSQISASLGDIRGNPLIASVCTQSRLEEAVSRITRPLNEGG